MGEVIAVVSGKGGVGKTTVAANIGAALALLKKRVLLVDADMGLRNLDIALGAESETVYDTADVLDGVCDISEAVIKIKEIEGLYFISSPQTRSSSCISDESFWELCKELKESYDFVIIDGPAGIGEGFFKAAGGADTAIVVAQGYTASLRDADRTVDILEKNGIAKIFVLINSVRPELIEKGIMFNLDYILDVLGTELIGIIPEDMKLLGNVKKLAATEDESVSKEAFFNTARRLLGEKVPVAEFNTEKRKKRRFFIRRKKDKKL